MTTGKTEDLLLLSEELDRKRIEASDDRDEGVVNLSWSPDSRSLLITISKIISIADRILQPDVYRVDLPERLISPLARACDGPPMGRVSSTTADVTSPDSGRSNPLPALHRRPPLRHLSQTSPELSPGQLSPCI